MSIKMPPRTIFDVETKTIGNPYELELSAIAIVNTEDGIPRFYDDLNMEDGIEQLVNAERLGGFNSIRFDNPVMLKYMTRAEGQEFIRKPHWDPLYEMQEQFKGQRAPLRNFAKTTLGEQKFELLRTSAAALATADARLLSVYNKVDTLLTYHLCIFAYQHGYLEFTLPVKRRLYFPYMNANLRWGGR